MPTPSPMPSVQFMLAHNAQYLPGRTSSKPHLARLCLNTASPPGGPEHFRAWERAFRGRVGWKWAAWRGAWTRLWQETSVTGMCVGAPVAREDHREGKPESSGSSHRNYVGLVPSWP